MSDFNRIDIRLTHPNLWRGMLVFAFINIGLGCNFLLTNPTFNPYMIPKEVIGCIFLGLGLLKLLYMTARRSLRKVRLVMTASIAFTLFWGVGTSITFFQGRTSLQLFVLYTGLAILNTLQLIEPVVNATTQVNQSHD